MAARLMGCGGIRCLEIVVYPWFLRGICGRQAACSSGEIAIYLFHQAFVVVFHCATGLACQNQAAQSFDLVLGVFQPAQGGPYDLARRAIPPLRDLLRDEGVKVGTQTDAGVLCHGRHTSCTKHWYMLVWQTRCVNAVGVASAVLGNRGLSLGDASAVTFHRP